MDMKTAAVKLLKLAEQLEKQASDSSYFICDKCNHTSNLTVINDRRKKSASQNNVAKVATVTINDKISCPACDGVLSYVETNESQKFYVEAAEDVPMLTDETPSDNPEEPVNPDEDNPDMPPAKDALPPEGDEPAEEGTTPSDIFKPVDEQEDGEKSPDLMFDEGPKEDAIRPPEGEGPMENEELPPEAPSDGEEPALKPSDDEEDKGSETDDEKADVPEVVEEEVPEDSVTPEDSDSEDSDSEEDVEFPKKKTPKFEKMPKEAAAFEASVAKYLM